MNKLVIVESPNKIKSIQKYLGKEYLVKASVGHVVMLPHSGVNNFGIDMETWTPNYKIDPKKKDVMKELKKAAVKAEVVYIATDPDREGEAIGENLVSFLKLEKKYKRIRFNEITENAIKLALKNPIKIDQDLVNAQIARRILDRIIGFKLSSLMRKKVRNTPAFPSAGRVQSIALKLVTKRELEIESFVPFKYNTIDAIISKDVKASFYCPDEKKINKTWVIPEKLDDIKSRLDKNLIVNSINISKRNEAKITPLKQSTLYKKADSQLKISSKAIQSASQRLYEGYGEGGLISYPRTDSTRLSDIFVKTSKEYIQKQYGKEYVATSIKGVSGAQDAHEAIRPTSFSMTPDKAKTLFNLGNIEYKVYKLIWNHTIQSLMTVPKRETLRYELESNGLNFRMSSSKVIFDGYYKVIGYSKQNELPKYLKGEKIKVKDYLIEPHETKPPARYNDGSLIEALDNIKVGRPSTFQTTVKVLKERKYVDILDRTMKTTKFGKIVNNQLIFAFPNIMNEKYTAKLELELDEISEGKHDYKNVLTNFWTKFQKELEIATEKMEVIKMELIKANKKCPSCGEELVVRTNKRDQSKFFGCSNFPKCKYTEFETDKDNKNAIKEKPLKANKKCPSCNSELMIRKNKRDGSTFFGCSNFPKCKHTEPDPNFKQEPKKIKNKK